MSSPFELEFLNPRNGSPALKLFSFEDNRYFDQVQRNNYFSLIWVTQGSGRIRADFAKYEFKKNYLFAFTPYQPFVFTPEEKFKGIAIQFHPEFYCIHLHQGNIACNGVLFNNIYYPPFAYTDRESTSTLEMLIGQMKKEIQIPGLSQYDLLVSYLKIILVVVARLKTQQQPEATLIDSASSKEPFVLDDLKNAIERDFRTKHSASDYAHALHIPVKTLAKITKTHFKKTLTELISERIIIEAKRELYLTNKPIKEIAYELGYDDEYYFSRFFKVNADVSPQLYRERVGRGQAMN